MIGSAQPGPGDKGQKRRARRAPILRVHDSKGYRVDCRWCGSRPAQRTQQSGGDMKRLIGKAVEKTTSWIGSSERTQIASVRWVHSQR